MANNVEDSSRCSPMGLSMDITDHSTEVEIYLRRYAAWLSEANSPSHQFVRFREMWPARFVELCKLHLSVLIDLPSDFLDEGILPNSPSGKNNTSNRQLTDNNAYLCNTQTRAHGPIKWPTRRWHCRKNVTVVQRQGVQNNGDLNTQGEGKSNNSFSRPNVLKQTLSKGFEMNSMVVRNIFTLMDTLDRDEYLATEGIFRKTGNVVRQRNIRQRILTELPLTSELLTEYNESKPWRPAGRSACVQDSSQKQSSYTNQINVHDLASGLKGVLYDLPEPLLTNRLLPLFVQVAGLTSGRVDEKGIRVHLRPVEIEIAQAKQLKALRLLCLLLPEPQSSLFKRLLTLLKRTLELADGNRMTVESLGTLFGPLLLSPGKVHTRDLHTQYTSFAKLATLMIVEGVDGLCKVPRSLEEDTERNRIFLEPPSAKKDGILTDALTHHGQSVPFSFGGPVNEHPLTRSASADSGLGWTDGSQPGSDVDSNVVRTQTQTSGSCGTDELPPLVTCINFAIRTQFTKDQTSEENSHTKTTEYAIAELYAAVQSLPDTDPRKRRLIHRFNATNGGLVTCSADTRRHGNIAGGGLQDLDTPLKENPFRRVNAVSGNSALKAAKTIRSSLRRKLAIRSNINMVSLFASPNTFETHSSKFRAGQHSSPDYTTPVNKPQHIVACNVTLEGEECRSPVFDNRIVQDKADRGFSPLYSVQSVTQTRLSLLSSNSISSGESGDLFCCPLVEALASPFRKRGGLHTPSSNSETSGSNTHASTASTAKGHRSAKRRFGCLSPIGSCDLSLRAEKSHFFDDGECSQPSVGCKNQRWMQDYFPIPALASTQWTTPPTHKMTSSASASKLPGTYLLQRVPTQTNLFSYGYRTVTSSLKTPEKFQLRRVHTMPMLRAQDMSTP